MMHCQQRIPGYLGQQAPGYSSHAMPQSTFVISSAPTGYRVPGSHITHPNVRGFSFPGPPRSPFLDRAALAGRQALDQQTSAPPRSPFVTQATLTALTSSTPRPRMPQYLPAAHLSRTNPIRVSQHNVLHIRHQALSNNNESDTILSGVSTRVHLSVSTFSELSRYDSEFEAGIEGRNLEKQEEEQLPAYSKNHDSVPAPDYETVVRVLT